MLSNLHIGARLNILGFTGVQFGRAVATPVFWQRKVSVDGAGVDSECIAIEFHVELSNINTFRIKGKVDTVHCQCSCPTRQEHKTQHLY